MIIGVPKETKTDEFRVGITPFGAQELKHKGHTILIEKNAGMGSGFSDEEYAAAGADIVQRKELFAKAELLVKVKEPIPPEYDLLENGQALFTYLHLAPNRALTDVLLQKKIIAVGYETLTRDGALPLLAPMSEIAGRMAPLMAAYYLQKTTGGSGILATGTNGVKPARIIEELFKGNVAAIQATARAIADEIRTADIIVGAVLVPGGRTPVLVTRPMLESMKTGSVIVDVSVDQGGCIETSHPTTHDHPVFIVDGIIHYCVANMPGAYPRTSTLALTNATLPYVVFIAENGIRKSVLDDSVMRSGLNTYDGTIVNNALAESMGIAARQ